MRSISRRVMLGTVVGGGAALGLALALGGEARASASYQSAYTFEQTWGSAMRLVRVDLGLKITEKDVDNGFLLFDYTSPESGSKTHRGSIEMVRTKAGVSVVVQIPAMPRYHEDMVVTALAKKLLDEHGDPPKKAPTPAPSAEPDAGS
jgi:hypothetical protein